MLMAEKKTAMNTGAQTVWSSARRANTDPVEDPGIHRNSAEYLQRNAGVTRQHAIQCDGCHDNATAMTTNQ